MKIEMTLTLKKSTKGTHVYANEDAYITQVYIRKEGLPTPPPQTVKITVEAE
jgi:hypothetical protein